MENEKKILEESIIYRIIYEWIEKQKDWKYITEELRKRVKIKKSIYVSIANELEKYRQKIQEIDLHDFLQELIEKYSLDMDDFCIDLDMEMIPLLESGRLDDAINVLKEKINDLTVETYVRELEELIEEQIERDWYDIVEDIVGE